MKNQFTPPLHKERYKYKRLFSLNKALCYCFPISEQLRQKLAKRLNCLPYEIK